MSNETETQAIAPAISLGFDNSDTFALLQRAAKMLSNSTLVPAQYRATKEVKEYGKVVRVEDNPNAVSNCVIALNIARRMRADELAVMQNLYIVEGRPSWSAQWVISAVNTCGKFSPIRFDMTDLGDEEVSYNVTEWVDGKKKTSVQKERISNQQCIAWVIERSTGDRLEGPPVSIKLAVQEGWYQKSGSKWQTMPQVMLRYRAASFFGKLYAPELLMGLPIDQEVLDEPTVREVTGREVAPAEVPAMFDRPKETAPAPAEEKPKPKRTSKPKVGEIPEQDLGKPEEPAAAAKEPQQVVVDDAGEQVAATLTEQFWTACDASGMESGLVMTILKKNGLTEADYPADLTEDDVQSIQPLWAQLKTAYKAEQKKNGGAAK